MDIPAPPLKEEIVEVRQTTPPNLEQVEHTQNLVKSHGPLNGVMEQRASSGRVDGDRTMFRKVYSDVGEETVRFRNCMSRVETIRATGGTNGDQHLSFQRGFHELAHLTSQESEAEQHADMLAHASTTAVLAAAGHETIPPNSQEQTVEVVKSIPQERVVERTMAQLVDVTLPYPPFLTDCPCFVCPRNVRGATLFFAVLPGAVRQINSKLHGRDWRGGQHMKLVRHVPNKGEWCSEA